MTLNRRDSLAAAFGLLGATALEANAAAAKTADLAGRLVTPDLGALKIVRVTSGADGISHFEEVTIPAKTGDFFGVKDGMKAYMDFRATRMSIFSVPGNIDLPVHNTRTKEMFYVVRGSSQLVTLDGRTYDMKPGMLVCFEDHTGKGRRGRTGPEGYTAIHISYLREDGTADAATAAAGEPPPFVLVHGTGHGGWCWKHVEAQLRAAGHRVFAPSLTGCGDRYHLRSREVGLDTHIQDVVGLIEAEELTNLVLVGHSYGGTVITGVCDRVRDRIRHAVYLEGPAPKNGSWNMSSTTREKFEAQIGPLVEGYLMPANPATIPQLGVPPEDKANTEWLRRRLTPHPVKTWFDPLRLENGGSDGLPRTFVLGTQHKPDSPFAQYAAKLRADPSWRVTELPGGHDFMVMAPRETAALLLDVARLPLKAP